MEAIVIFNEERICDYVLMDYHLEDGSGFQRFFGTDVILSDWERF